MAKQTVKQKFLSALLAVSMMAGMFPAGALAAGSTPATAVPSAAAAEETLAAGSENMQEVTVSADTNTDAVPDEQPLAVYADDTGSAPAAAATTPDNAYFITDVKLVPSDVKLEVPADYTQAWEPEVQWDTDTEISRDANVSLWLKYVMPDPAQQPTPEKGKNYVSYIQAPLTCDKAMNTVITCGTDQVATVRVEGTDTPGLLKLTIRFDESADEKYFKQGVPGYFWVMPKFDASQIENNGKQPLQISIVGGTTTTTPEINFAFTEPTVEAAAEKKLAGVDETAQTITWTTDITVKGSDLPASENVHTTTIRLDDTMQNQKYVDGTATIVAVDGSTAHTLAVTASGQQFDADTMTGSVHFEIANVPLDNNTHTVQISYQTSYAGLTLPIAASKNNTVAQIQFVNKISGEATVPNYKKDPATGKPTLDPAEKTTAIAESTADADLQVAQLEKNVSTTNLGNVNITAKEGKLFWQILVDSSLPNQVLYDTIQAGHTLIVDAKHPLYIGTYEKVKGSDNKEVARYVGTPAEYTTVLPQGSTETGIAQGNAANQFVIHLGNATGKTMVCYYTEINGSTEALVNRVALKADGFGPDMSLSTQKTYDLRHSFLTKHGIYYDAATQKITWQAVVTNGGILSDTLTLVDTFSSSRADSTIKKYDQKLLNTSTDPFTITVKRSAGSTKYQLVGTAFINEHDATDTIGTISICIQGNDYADTGFTIKLFKLGDYEQILLDYKTQLIASDQDGVETDLKAWINQTVGVSNKIQVIPSNHMPSMTESWNWSCSTPVLKKEPALLDAEGFAAAGDAAANKNYDYETGTAAWKITVNEAQMEIQPNVVLTDVLDYGDDAPWSYVEDSIKVKLGDTVVADADITKEFGTNADGKPTMTLTLPGVDANGGTYVITYRTMVDKTKLGTNAEQTLTNSVTLKGGPIKTGVTETSNVKITAGQIAKKLGDTKNYWQDHLLSWEITVNNNLADLSDAATDPVSIYDTLESGLLYMEDAEVWKFTKTKADGTPDDLTQLPQSAVNAAYDEENHILTFSFTKQELNGTGYVIRYKTRVMDGQAHSNTARFNVQEDASGDHSSSASYEEYYGNGYTIIPNTATVLIRKQKTDGSALAGAEFTISRQMDNGRWTAVGTITSSGTYKTITGADFAQNAGMVGLPYGHYKIEETKTPTGYLAGFVQEFDLDADHTIKLITCTNYTEAEGGSLKITKTISGPVAESRVEPSLKFTVIDPYDRTIGEYTLDQFTKENGRYTLTVGTALIPGEYTVTETAEAVDGYKLVKTTYTLGTTAQDGTQAVAAVNSGSETIVAYVNTYESTTVITPPPVTPPTTPPTVPPTTPPTVLPTTSPKPSQEPTPTPTPADDAPETPAASTTPQPTSTPQPAGTPQATPQSTVAPQTVIPQTSDAFPLLLLTLTMAASGLALAVLAITKKRSKHE